MKLKLLSISFMMFFFFVTTVYAQVVINEVSPKDEWVELFNTSSEAFDLTGCTLYLHDESTSNQKIVFEKNLSIDKFLVINKGSYGWTSNWLNNSGDNVEIKCTDFQDVVAYGSHDNSLVDAPDELSFGRNPDGVGGYYVLAESTPGSPNAKPPSPTPTVTLSPTKTPTPTRIPTPTKTPTPTKILIPSDIPTSTPKPKPSATLIVNNNKEEVLGDKDENVTTNKLAKISEDEDNNESKSPDRTLVESETSGKFPLAAAVMILGGASMIGGAFYPIFKRKKMHYNGKSDEI